MILVAYFRKSYNVSKNVRRILVVENENYIGMRCHCFLSNEIPELSVVSK